MESKRGAGGPPLLMDKLKMNSIMPEFSPTTKKILQISQQEQITSNEWNFLLKELDEINKKTQDPQIIDLINASKAKIAELSQENSQGSAGPSTKSPMNSQDRTPTPAIKYGRYAIPPYIVLIKPTADADNTNFSSIHPMILGRIFKNNGISDIKNISRKGRNCVGVEFENFTAANSLLEHDVLKKNKLEAFIPYNQVTCRGVVRNIDPNISEEELLNNIESMFEVVQIRRMNRRVVDENGEATTKPTATVVITFLGRTMPEKVGIYKVYEHVEVYIPPVIQCMQCGRFGHIAKNCRGKETCKRCGQPTRDNRRSRDEDIDMEEDEAEMADHTTCEIKCLHCNGNHEYTNKKCPEATRQTKLREIMAFNNITYFEANQLIPKEKEANTQINRGTQNFPALPNKNPTPGIIPIEHRRNYSSRNFTNNHQYNKITQKRKIVNNNALEGHKQLINEAAYNLNTIRNPIQNNPHRSSDLERFIHEFKEKVESLQIPQSQTYNTWHQIINLLKPTTLTNNNITNNEPEHSNEKTPLQGSSLELPQH